jgi:hypothetical protein
MDGECWHYTYYSYEQGGRGYIGKRTSKVPPKDDPYLGSFSDKTFKPTNKIIIATYDSAVKALRAESALQRLFQAHKAEHFANQAIYSFGKFRRLAKRARGWKKLAKQEKRRETARRLLELEKNVPQSELDTWIPVLDVIEQERRRLIEEGTADQLQSICFLKNPYGVTYPVTDLEIFCKNCRLSFYGIQKLLAGKINSWHGWSRGEADFS